MSGMQREEAPEVLTSESDSTFPKQRRSNVKKTSDWCLLGLLGIIAAGCLVYYGITLWNDPHTYLPGRKMQQGIWLSGDGARALAVSSMGGGLYFHARWMWGTLGFIRVSEKLTYLSSLLILGGIVAMYGLSFYQ
jgi:hypothetical protein